MPKCSAYNCFERGRRGGASFHIFPKDEKLKRKWCQMIRRENFTPSKYSKLCSKHFQETDFERHFGQCKLKKGVIPSIFSRSKNTPPKRKPPMQRTLNETPPSKRKSTKMDVSHEKIINSAGTEYPFQPRSDIQTNATQINATHTKDISSTNSRSTNSLILDTGDDSFKNCDDAVAHTLFMKDEHSNNNALINDIHIKDAVSTHSRSTDNSILDTNDDSFKPSDDTVAHTLFIKDEHSNNNALINDIHIKDTVSINGRSTENSILDMGDDSFKNSDDAVAHTLFIKDEHNNNNSLMNDVHTKDAVSTNSISTDNLNLDAGIDRAGNSCGTEDPILFYKDVPSNNTLIHEIHEKVATSPESGDTMSLNLCIGINRAVNSGGAEDHILFPQDLQSNYTQINEIHEKVATSTNSLATERITKNPVPFKRRKFAGDYTLSDMSSHEKAKKFFESATAVIKKKNKLAKTLHQKIRRLEDRVKDLSSLFYLCVEKFRLSEEEIHALKQRCAAKNLTDEGRLKVKSCEQNLANILNYNTTAHNCCTNSKI